MIRKKITAIMTAAMMMFCILCGGNLQSVSAVVADKTVYIAVQPSAGMPGSRVPVTIDIRTDYFVSMMSVRVHYVMDFGTKVAKKIDTGLLRWPKNTIFAGN